MFEDDFVCTLATITFHLFFSLRIKSKHIYSFCKFAFLLLYLYNTGNHGWMLEKCRMVSNHDDDIVLVNQSSDVTI